MASLNWSYQGTNGPDQWHKLYPIANGNNQSPIDIKTKIVKKDPSLGHLQITWNLSTCKEIVNVGHSFHVMFEDKDNQSVVTGGPLTGNYRLHQFHFHWGQTDDHGSEHTVDGAKYASEVNLMTQTGIFVCYLGGASYNQWTLPTRKFSTGDGARAISFMQPRYERGLPSEQLPATLDSEPGLSLSSPELHLVHWNSDKYSSFTEALDKPDGLAIIAVFLKVGSPNEHVQKIVKALGSVKTKDKKAPFTNFDPSTLLPGSLDYWTYHGSLTHPPLLESVTWIICKEPITISSEQLDQFRSLILTNHRLPQPLKGRQVRT